MRATRPGAPRRGWCRYRVRVRQRFVANRAITLHARLTPTMALPGCSDIVRVMSTPDGAMEASAGEYGVDEDDQLQPEDTLIDRGVDDVLDEGYSPPEQPYPRGSLGSTPESLEQLLAEEEPDPAMRLS